MSLNMERSKKLSPFVPFNDFRNNLADVENKMIQDLKKFGYSGAKNLKPGSLQPAFGD